MSKPARTLLFISLTIIFLIAGAMLVFYSGGSRFNFKDFKVVQTGGIYLKTEPADVNIRINGKPVENKSGILQSGTFVSNLKPGTYKTMIQKDGYHPWEKEIRVESSTAAVFDGIILFPKESHLTASNTDKFLLELSGGITTASEFNRLSSLFNQLKEAQLLLPGAVQIKKILPYPYNERKFVLMTDRALYTLDTEKEVLSQVSPRARDFTFAGNDLFWIEDKGLFSLNLILRTQSEINLPEELEPARFAKIEVSPSGQIIAILKKDNELVLLERSTNKITSLGTDVTNFIFAPDSKKIAFTLGDGSLSIYGIKDGVQKEKYILEKISAPWVGAKEILWHEDNNYIFLKDKDNKLYFVEVNDYPPTNIVEVSSQVKNFTYNKDDNSLYWETPQGIWQVKL